MVFYQLKTLYFIHHIFHTNTQHNSDYHLRMSLENSNKAHNSPPLTYRYLWCTSLTVTVGTLLNSLGICCEKGADNNALALMCMDRKQGHFYLNLPINFQTLGTGMYQLEITRVAVSLRIKFLLFTLITPSSWSNYNYSYSWIDVSMSPTSGCNYSANHVLIVPLTLIFTMYKAEV